MAVKLQPPKPLFQLTFIQDVFCKSIVRGFLDGHSINNNVDTRLIASKKLKSPLTRPFMNQTFQLSISDKKDWELVLYYSKFCQKILLRQFITEKDNIILVSRLSIFDRQFSIFSH